jgi:hypothetical protein
LNHQRGAGLAELTRRCDEDDVASPQTQPSVA